MTMGTDTHALALEGARAIHERLRRDAQELDLRRIPFTTAAEIARNDALAWDEVAGALAAGDPQVAAERWHAMDTFVRDQVDALPNEQRHALASVLGFEVIR